MVSLGKRFQPQSISRDPILQAAVEREMQMDIVHRARLKDLSKRAALLGYAIWHSSSELRTAKELRGFWREYFERFMQHGPHSLPSSFNVVEAFMAFHRDLLTFDLRPENEHLLAFGHYLDWYTAGNFPEEPGALVDIMEEGTIYSYDFVLALDQPFLKADASDLAVAGIALIRHQDELSALVLAGERPPVDPYSAEGTPYPGRESLGPAPSLTASDRLLEGTSDFSRVILATRFNLSSRWSDARYVMVDRGSSYQVATDDLEVAVPGFSSRPFDPQLLRLREAQQATLARYADLFSATASLIYLPAFFVAQARDSHDTEFLTQLGADAKGPKTRRIRKELGDNYYHPRRTVHCMPAPPTSRSSQFTVRPPELRSASLGFWKALLPGEIGSAHDGTPIVGKTWVQRTETWESTTPTDFLAKRLQPTALNAEYIYVTRSPSHVADLYKVGMTTREVGARVAELSGSTSAPLPFEILAYWPVPDAALAERVVHEALAPYRVSARREFFRAPLPRIIQTIDRVLASQAE